MSLEQFYRPTIPEQELNTGRSKEFSIEYPVLSGLEEIVGDPAFDQIKDLTTRYKTLFATTKKITDETGQEISATYYRDPLVFIVAGPIGTGKTTTCKEMNSYFVKNGFDVLTMTYEEALAFWHPDPEQDMDPKLFPKVNHTLSMEVINALHEYPNPTVLLIEAPIVSELNPRTEKKRKQRSKTNRDRAATAAMKIAPYLEDHPIYFIAMTSNLDKQEEFVKEREEILQLSDEHFFDYLHSKGIIQESSEKDWEIDTKSLRKELQTMGMPRHFKTMKRELNNHKTKLIKRIIFENFNRLMEVRRNTMNREQTPEDYIIVLNQLTFREFIIDLGVMPKRIIDAYNPSSEKNHPGYYKSHIHPKTEE